MGAGVFILKLPQAAPLISKWAGLVSAAAPNDKSWAGPNSEQWAFDANLAHLRCVKLVTEVDFAARSPTFETNTAPF
eukprot:7160392-Pyramimonas_sp.AAC.1